MNITNRKERCKKIKTTFNKLINEGKEGAFVVFTSPEAEKFVQFVYEFKERWLICDIPLIELSKEEEEKIKLIMGEGSATDADTGEKISYQEWFTAHEVDRATKLVETIFIDVFNLPDSFTIKSELVLDSGELVLDSEKMTKKKDEEFEKMKKLAHIMTLKEWLKESKDPKEIEFLKKELEKELNQEHKG